LTVGGLKQSALDLTPSVGHSGGLHYSSLGTFQEAGGEAAALVWCQAQPHVGGDGELDAAADQISIAIGAGPAVAALGWRSVRGGAGLPSGLENGWVWGHGTDPTDYGRRPAGARKVPAIHRK
jgi:hypothetical protein